MKRPKYLKRRWYDAHIKQIRNAIAVRYYHAIMTSSLGHGPPYFIGDVAYGDDGKPFVPKLDLSQRYYRGRLWPI